MGHAARLGLDVHNETIAVATLRPGQELPEERVIPNAPGALRVTLLPSGGALAPPRCRSSLVLPDSSPVWARLHRLAARHIDCGLRPRARSQLAGRHLLPEPRLRDCGLCAEGALETRR
jgi:hypothetical protein